MYRPIPYPTNDVDPRLINVTENVKRLKKIVSDKDWNGEDCQREREELSKFLSAFNEGRLWLPKF